VPTLLIEYSGHVNDDDDDNVEMSRLLICRG